MADRYHLSYRYAGNGKIWDEATGAAIPIEQASVDRKKSTDHYMPGNCRWIHLGLNLFLNNAANDSGLKV